MKKTPRVRAGMALVVSGTLALAACHGDDDDNNINNALANNTLPNFIAGSVKTQTYDGNDRRPADRRPRQDRPRLRDAARDRQRRPADGRRTAASRDLFELPRARRHVGEWRLRALLGAERRPERQRHARRRQDRRQGIPRLRRRRQRHEERESARADSSELQPGPAVHRHGDVIGLARRVRRDLGGGRVGPETRLRGRLHRQGQRQRRARTLDQPRDADRRHAHGRERSPARGSIFTANLGSTSLSTFNTNFPNRYAFKHAHSQQNPEKDWGTNTLQAIQFAYWALNDSYGPLDGTTRKVRYTKGSMTTIAASVSNGGGASLAAAEQDTDGWITAVVVGEPQINLNLPSQVSVRQGGVSVGAFGSPLADYTTFANLLQPCAALATGRRSARRISRRCRSRRRYAIRTARCASLAASGLVSGGDHAGTRRATRSRSCIRPATRPIPTRCRLRCGIRRRCRRSPSRMRTRTCRRASPITFATSASARRIR